MSASNPGSEESGTFARSVEAVKQGADPLTQAAQLYEQLSEDERLSLLDGDQPFWEGMESLVRDGYNLVPYVMGAVDRLGIPGIRFADGPRGCVMGNATCFPVSMARGATWDEDLEREVGEVIGEEIRALGANFFGGVCINLPRHPAWGRVQETYSDQPVLLGKLGAALAQGVQQNAMACVKHYALNSMENSRFSVDVTISEADLHAYFLPHFKQVIDAGAYAVMSAYNSVNGTWAGQNETLLTDILRDQWGFEGVVISDFIWGSRGAGPSLAAGLDVEAPLSQQRNAWLREDLDQGVADWSHVERAAMRILSTQLRSYAGRLPQDPDLSAVASPSHIALAKRVADRSMVLLKNAATDDAPLLPLDPAALSSVAVLGRLADTENTGDHGSSKVRPSYVVTPLKGMLSALQGTSVRVDSDTTGNVQTSAELAANSDVAVVVVGYTSANEGEYLDGESFVTRDDLLALYPDPTNAQEASQRDSVVSILKGGTNVIGPGDAGGDRDDLSLPAEDIALIRAVAARNPRTIVVIEAAGAVTVSEWKDTVPAIVMAWYPGMEGGTALSDLLLGRTNPSGRLPYPIPVNSADEPPFDRDWTELTYDRWFSHRLLQRDGIQADYPLGFGLSYTSYALSDLQATRSGDQLEVTVSVRNTGAMAGHHVVQIYGSHTQGTRKDERELLGFGTIEVNPGQTASLRIEAPLLPLGTWNATTRRLEVDDQPLQIEASSFWGDPDAQTAEV